MWKSFPAIWWFWLWAVGPMTGCSSPHSWRGSIASSDATKYADLPAAVANTRYRIVTTVNGTEETQDLNGEIRKLTFPAVQSHQDGITCFLGAYRIVRSTGDAPNGRWPCRIYGAKIYTNSTDAASGVLAREYVPCYSPCERKYGLWESVTGTFVPSLEGDFGGADMPETPELIDTSRSEPPGKPTWQEVYEPVQYIRSTGSQFVNTGIQMQDKLTLDIDYEWTCGFLNYAVLFGAFAAEDGKEYRCYLGYNRDKLLESNVGKNYGLSVRCLMD